MPLKTQAELEDLMNDPVKFADHLSGVIAEQFGAALGPQVRTLVDSQVGEYTKAQDVRLKELVDAQVLEILNRKSVNRLPQTPAQRVAGYSPHAPGAVLDGQFKSFGELAIAIHGTNRGMIDARLKALNEGAGADGGFLVPEEFRAQLMMLALQESYIRARAMVLPMPRGNLSFPVIKDTSHVTNVFGGVVANWQAEAGDISTGESEPTFAQARLVAKKLTGYTIASNELLNDSAVGVEALLMQLFPEAIRYFEEEAFINGTGGGQPNGILNASCKVSVAKQTGQAAATVVYENITTMYPRMLPSSVNRAIWLYNPEVFPQLATMAINVGTGGSAVWISNIVGGPPATIMGRPAYPTEHCQALGTEGDLMFVDPAYYMIGDTQGLAVASSPHVKFVTDQTVWKFVERLDGRPWLESALTPRYGSNTISPIVTLATRS